MQKRAGPKGGVFPPALLNDPKKSNETPFDVAMPNENVHQIGRTDSFTLVDEEDLLLINNNG